LPPHVVAGTKHSYEQGHLSEFEVQEMVNSAVATLRAVPGRQLSKSQKSQKHETKKRRGSGRHGPRQILGLSILSGSRKSSADAQAAWRSSGGESGGESGSGSDAERQPMARHRESGVQQWRLLAEKDLGEKRRDSEWSEADYLQAYLYWMVKVKSDYHWQPPLIEAIAQMREAMVEEVVEVSVRSKRDLATLHGIINEKYVVRETTRFCEVDLPRDARMLPLGTFAGKNLKSAIWWEKLESLHPPVTAYFGWAKADITHQKVEHMKEVHMQKLRWCGRFLTSVLQSVEDILQDVADDFSMSASLESTMPCPPQLSHLYLKHCEGRELAQDAVTPRSDVGSESSGDAAMFAEMPSACSVAGRELDTLPAGTDSVADPHLAVGRSSKMGEGRRKRLDRNTVLSHAKA